MTLHNRVLYNRVSYNIPEMIYNTLLYNIICYITQVDVIQLSWYAIQNVVLYNVCECYITPLVYKTSPNDYVTGYITCYITSFATCAFQSSALPSSAGTRSFLCHFSVAAACRRLSLIRSLSSAELLPQWHAVAGPSHTATSRG
jgi:hypothetical protein